jgi:hypothetical protein
MSNVTKEFSSLDVGASLLLANTGRGLITILDSILINGYNTVNTTLVTVTSNVATCNTITNTYTVGQCLLIAGANGAYSGLNGEYYVTSSTSNSFSFLANSIPDGTATGAITAKVAPLGWTAAFSSANTQSYRQGGGQQYYVQVDNPSQQAKWCMFETMTAANTGTNQTPTPAQLTNLGWQLLSTTTLLATPKNWYAIGNDRSFYFFVSADASVNWTSIFVGDFTSYKSGDLYNSMVSGNAGASLTSPLSGATHFATWTAWNSATSLCKYVLRPHTGLGSSTLAGFGVDAFFTGGLPYPNPADGSLVLSKFLISDGVSLRGELPGTYTIRNGTPFNGMDTFDGAGTTSGMKFRIYNAISSGAQIQLAIQRLAPWVY